MLSASKHPTTSALFKVFKRFLASVGVINWEAIAVCAKAGIGYRGVASLIPPSVLPTLSEVDEGEVTISIKH